MRYLLTAFILLATSLAQAVTIDMVTVGNPGNTADKRYTTFPPDPGFGSVGYSFNIGATEVTNAQYTAMLNAVAATDTYGLYSSFMGSVLRGGIVRSGSPGSYTYAIKTPAIGKGPGGTDYAYDNKPVVTVNWGDAARFANWMHNGQPIGAEDATTTEGGAYTLNGAITDEALAAVTRNAGARWWLPNENEWHKAAYHKNDGVTGNYWDYPTRTNTLPNNNLPSADTGNSANFYDNGYATDDFDYPFTDVGAYFSSHGPYGTFDQGGNAREWNETAVGTFDSRGIRGGTWLQPSNRLHASNPQPNRGNPTSEDATIGFRLASFVGVSGDYNGDGEVDAADYAAWRRNAAGHGGMPGYNTWRVNFGASGSGAFATTGIPEPSTVLLAFAAATMIASRRNRV